MKAVRALLLAVKDQRVRAPPSLEKCEKSGNVAIKDALSGCEGV
jgi:hypothetical protein